MKKYLLNLGLIATFIFGGNVWGQVSYSGNSNSGFGGVVGDSTLEFSDNGTTVTGTFTKGAGDFNDAMVVYISTGSAGRTVIDGDVIDQGDDLRRAISSAGEFASNITFPSGFQATHAIAINVAFGGLWNIPNTGIIGNNELEFVAGVGSPDAVGSASFSFSFTWANIGLTSSDHFEFVVTYLNAGNGFLSDEGYGEGLPSGNPGGNNVTFTSFLNYPFYYKYDNSWSPNSPSGENQPNRDVLVENGTATFSGNTIVRDISVENGAILQIGSQAVLKSEGDITNNGNLVFKSDSNGSGQLDEFTGEITGTGDVTVERFIPKRSDNTRAFRFLASPVSDVSIVNSWQENMHVTGAGGATNGFDATDSNSPSMFTFDGGWQAVGNTNVVEFVHGRGYRTFVRGDRTVALDNNTASANDVTISAKGTLATGSVSAPDMAIGNHEFSFVGNPYQAVVDLGVATMYGNGIENGFAYYWDPTLADSGAFVTITTGNSDNATVTDVSIPSPGSTAVNKFLQPGQAVFFRNTNTAGDRTITFTESAKQTGQAQTAVFSEPNTPYVNMRLYEATRFANGGKEQDATGLRFLENGNNGIDAGDASKMGNSSENFAMLSNNQLISLESRNLPQEGEIYSLFTNNYQHDNYVFHINIQNFPEDLVLRLNDNHLNEIHTLETGINEVHFSVDLSVAGSTNSERFSLEVGSISLSVEELAQNSLEIYPNPVTDVLSIRIDTRKQAKQVSIYNLIGKEVARYSLDASKEINQISTTSLSTGVYLVQIQTSEGNFTQKLIKK